MDLDLELVLGPLPFAQKPIETSKYLHNCFQYFFSFLDYHKRCRITLLSGHYTLIVYLSKYICI